MPALSARRALVTGMRAFPFRDWRATRGLPGGAGLQPGLGPPAAADGGHARGAGVETIYVTRQPDLRRAALRGRAATRAARQREHRARHRRRAAALASSASRTPPRAHVRARASSALREVKGAELVLRRGGPVRPARTPTRRRRSTCGPGEVEDDGLGPTDGRIVELKFSDKDIDRVREALRGPRRGGRRRARQADGRRVAGRHRSCSCSATTASRSASTATSAGGAHLAPDLVRDPVPDPPSGRREVGRRRGLVRLDARRGAHAAVLPGPEHPGQDGRRGPHRAVRRRGRGGPARPPQVDHGRRAPDHRPRPPLAGGGGPRADRAPDVRRRRGGRGRHHALRQHRQRGPGQAHRAVGGGADRRRRARCPSSAPTARCARRASAATTTRTTTASRTTSTRSTTTSPTTASRRRTSSSTGAYPRAASCRRWRSRELARREPRRAGPRENPSAEFLYENKWRIFGVMMIGWAMSLLDISIVNISIPELQDEMSTDIGDRHLGHQRLQHRLRGPARVDGPARGPVRPPPLLRARPGGVHDRLGAVRRGVVGRVADRLPRDPGRRARASSRRSASR